MYIHRPKFSQYTYLFIAETFAGKKWCPLSTGFTLLKVLLYSRFSSFFFKNKQDFKGFLSPKRQECAILICHNPIKACQRLIHA